MNFKSTAIYILEEGGDDVKSHGPYGWATHATMAMTVRSNGVSRSNSINVALVRIVGLTRLHEVGIASNRRSARYGELVLGLVHTARHPGNCF